MSINLGGEDMFCNRLKDLREEAKISQSYLAKQLYVSQQTVAKWELNKTTPNPDMLIKIADYFDVTVDYLIGRNEFSIDSSREVLLPSDNKKVLNYYNRLNQEDKEWIIGKMIDAYRQYNKNKDMETASELDAHITEDIKNLTKSQNKN